VYPLESDWKKFHFLLYNQPPTLQNIIGFYLKLSQKVFFLVKAIPRAKMLWHFGYNARETNE
jgi:hypothetical protein